MKAANKSLNESDLLLALGTRLSWRQIRAKPREFLQNGKLVHVDIDREELNQRVPATLAFDWDVKIFLRQLIAQMRIDPLPNHEAWASDCRLSLKNIPFCKDIYLENSSPVQPYVFMKLLSDSLDDTDILVIDAGQNVMWGMQTLEPRGDQRMITAWGHSPMGYSLPASMGVAAHYGNKRRTICTIGDGGFQVNIQELQTIKYYNLPIKIFILNNHSYGAIKDYQDGNLSGRHYATCPEFGYEPPDLLAIAEAYQIKTCRINSHIGLKEMISEVLTHEGPIVCDVDLGNDTFVTLDP